MASRQEGREAILGHDWALASTAGLAAAPSLRFHVLLHRTHDLDDSLSSLVVSASITQEGLKQKTSRRMKAGSCCRKPLETLLFVRKSFYLLPFRDYQPLVSRDLMILKQFIWQFKFLT